MNALEKLIQDYMGWVHKQKLPFKAADVLLMDHYDELTFYQKMFLTEFLRTWIKTFKSEFGEGL